MAQSEAPPFLFPLKPYAIQVQFATALVETLRDRRIGVFESPTGTGKSLSIICGALHWLTEDLPREEAAASGAAPVSDAEAAAAASGDWLAEFAEKRKREALAQERQALAEKKAKMKKKLADLRAEVEKAGHRPLKRAKAPAQPSEEHGDAGQDAVHLLPDCPGDTAPPDSDSDDEDKVDADDEEYDEPKVFYCSRTHSQLSQFIGELRKTQYGSAGALCVVCLAGRRQLCIRPDVRSMSSTTALNDKCLDLVAHGNCHYCDERQVLTFRDHALSTVRDVEELAELGERLLCCPYYGARKAIRLAQLVVLPYQMMLSKETRESLGISLKGNVVVLDEAHNIIETINEMHTVEVSFPQLELGVEQLQAYLHRFQTMLNAQNLVNVKQTLVVVETLKAALATGNGEGTKMETPNDFLFRTNLDTIDMFQLHKFFRESHICFKVNSFNETRKKRAQSDQESEPEKRTIRFLLLNPERHFKQVLDEARSVVLAGGTLQPIASITKQLVDPCHVERLRFFSCGHVIPAENFLVVPMTCGPNRCNFDFTYNSRRSESLMEDVGRALCNICNVVPDGVVVFFPSYSYLDLVEAHWEKCGVASALRTKKEVNILRSTMMWNSSLTLPRCVVMVGMPYPNPHDPVLVEKVSYAAGRLGSSSEYLEDLCMKAVNQSIGRAIRHAADYAVIVLADGRYARASVQAKLPKWVSASIVPGPYAFSCAFPAVAKFFQGKRAR
eukprot:m51a1_g810 putative dead_2 domain protein (728) ;mRNA; f:677794-680679